MRPGSKGWIMFMKKIYFFSLSLVIICLTFDFLVWQKMLTIHFVFEILLKIVFWISISVLILFEFLAIFNPYNITSKPNWALVYPQLRKQFNNK